MKLVISSLVLLVVFFVFGSSDAFAQNIVQKIDNTCETIDTKIENTSNRFNELNESLSTTQKETTATIQTGIKTTDTKIAEERKKAKDSRFQAYKILRSKTENEEQKLAVEVFISSLEKAVNKRQKSYDLTIEQFNRELGMVYVQKLQIATETSQNYTLSFSESLKTASSSCKQGDASIEVKQNLLEQLSTSNSEYISDTKDIRKYNLQQIVKHRDEGLNLAKAYFESTLQELVSKLKEQLN